MTRRRIAAVLAVALVAAPAAAYSAQLEERDVAAAALLVLWAAAGCLIIALHLSRERAEPTDQRSQEPRGVMDAEELRRARATPQGRARELLRSHLNEAQRAEFDRTGSFVVVAASGRRYRIRTAATFNVRDETASNDYCIQFRFDRQSRDIPLEDVMLAQKVLLECDEPEFLRVANRRRTSTPLDYPL